MKCGEPLCRREDAESHCSYDDKPMCPLHGPAGAKHAMCDRHRRLVADLLAHSRPAKRG